MNVNTSSFFVTITAYYKSEGVNFLKLDIVNKPLDKGLFTYKGTNYYHVPFDVDTLSDSLANSDGKVKIKVGNSTNPDINLNAFKLAYTRFESGTVDITVCNVKGEVNASSTSNLEIHELLVTRYKIVSIDNINANGFELTLQKHFNVTTNIPYKVLSSKCTHDFCDRYCGYAGSATSCDKTFATCKRLGNLDRFNGVLSDGKF